MKARAVWMVVLTLAVVLFLGAGAEAQLPKSGTYTGHAGYAFAGKVYEVEKDHVVFLGEWSGTYFNDAGEGFLHHVSMSCQGINDLLKGIFNAHGSCADTDQDTDKIFLVWKCQGTAPHCDGDYQWTGGTGKYTGITGGGTFNSAGVGATSSAYFSFRGDYRLP